MNQMRAQLGMPRERNDQETSAHSPEPVKIIAMDSVMGNVFSMYSRPEAALRDFSRREVLQANVPSGDTRAGRGGDSRSDSVGAPRRPGSADGWTAAAANTTREDRDATRWSTAQGAKAQAPRHTPEKISETEE